MCENDLHAKVTYHSFSTDNYQWKPFCSFPERGTTIWEQKCLDTTNTFLDELFNIDGFKDFFLKNHCRLRKELVASFLNEKGSCLTFPTIGEYKEPFGWEWCQLNEKNSPGHIMDWNGWLYDKLAVPTITVSVNGKEFQPFKDREQCFSSCVAEDRFAWRVCEASAYNVPYLYSIVKAFKCNTSYLYEGAFYSTMDDKLYKVLKLFDDRILPTYKVIVEEDTMLIKSGCYPMHIVDVSKQNLREIIRKYKTMINSIIHDYDH